MDEPVLLSAVEQICRRTFKNNSLRLTTTATAADVEGWDSLTHVILLHNIEKHFKIKIAIREAMNLDNVGALVALIHRKVA